MATDEILSYRATSPLEEFSLSEPNTKTFSKIKEITLQTNPYFDKVQDIINKFGPIPSPYYTMTVYLYVKIQGKIGSEFTQFAVNCKVGFKDMLNCCVPFYLNNQLVNKDLFYGFIDGNPTQSMEGKFPVSNALQLNSITLKLYVLNQEFNTCKWSGPFTINAQVVVEGQIYMKKYCDQNYIDNICTIFCSDDRNLNLCKDSNISYCFNNLSEPQFSRFFQSDKCKIFVKQYFAKNTSHPEYDKIFKQICKNLEVDASNYKNYTNGNDPQLDLDIKNICACNLDDSIYNNFYESFATEIPTIRATNFGSKKCIFPECNTSEYKPTEIMGYNVCPRIDCINVSQIDNDGRIIGGLTINQSNNCPNIQDSRRPCNQDGDCGIGKKCLQGVCVEENVCRVNTNCNPDTKCYNNICVRDDYCGKDSDCGEGLKCSKNVCVKNIVATNNITLIIFISVIVLLLVLFGIIILIYFIKKSKRNK
jgi:hypothetical protein